MSHFSYNKTQHPFFDTLQKRVYDYFESNNKDMHGGTRIVLKSIFFILVAVLNYIALLWLVPPGFYSVLLCILMGGLLAGIGFNMMHDGAHGSFSKYTWLNEIMGWSLNVMGGDVNLWKIKHNLTHHSFTNVEGLDDDIDIKPWVRTNRFQEYKSFHKYQHLYVSFFYLFTYLYWFSFADFEKYFTRSVGDVKFRKFSTRAHISFWIGKVLFLFLALILPIMVVGVVKTLVGFIVVTFTCGILLALVFQVAHVVNNLEFLDSQDKKTDMEWAVTQLKSTANFAPRSKWMLFLTGGLNHQVEHHLFPRISHVHYPVISEIVKKTCQEFNIPYYEYPTFRSAVVSHYSHLRKMGAQA